MEITEIISHHIDKIQNMIVVEFKTTEDDEDMVREDFIEYNFLEEFGYTDETFEIFESIDDEDYDEWVDDDVDYVDEEKLISFLNEYYVVYPKKLPKAQFK